MMVIYGYIWLLLVIGLGRCSSQSSHLKIPCLGLVVASPLRYLDEANDDFKGVRHPMKKPVKLGRNMSTLAQFETQILRSAEESLDFCRYSESM